MKGAIEPETPGSPLKSITLITEQGGRLDWSPTQDIIVVDGYGEDNVYQIYTINPDGSGRVCLTCNKPNAPGRNKGNPAWHPSGNYIVFQAEKQEHSGFSMLSTPGLGKDNDVWLMSSDGNDYYKLTDVSQGMSVLHPHFSHDGSKLMWVEKVGTGKSNKDEQWALRIADFMTVAGQPSLANVKTYQPLGPVFYESHGFSRDDTEIIFTAYLNPDQQAGSWMDIFALNLETLTLNQLTHTIENWDEHGHYSRSGNTISWISSADCACDPASIRGLETDAWLMDADGSNKVRLTYFNDADQPEYISRHTIVADNSWSPDGRKLALYITNGQRLLQEKIVVLEFESPQ